MITSTTVGAFEARRKFGSILRDVEAKGRVVVVERHGEEVAAVVPMQLYTQWKKTRDDFFAKIRQGASHAKLSEATANVLADKAIKVVRSRK